MPAISKHQAAEKLACSVENARPSDLAEVYAELFPESASIPLAAGEIARYIRAGIEAEEIVDLWNVMFPTDHNVWYDEEEDTIRYNEEMIGSAD